MPQVTRFTHAPVQAVDHPYLVVHSATAPGAKAAAKLPRGALAALPEVGSEGGLGAPPVRSPGACSQSDTCGICCDPPEVGCCRHRCCGPCPSPGCQWVGGAMSTSAVTAIRLTKTQGSKLSCLTLTGQTDTQG